MNIFITYGSGTGITKLAAFDSALYNAGIANFNLIRLSSVIPPKSKVIIKKLNWNNKEYGHKLYVVLSFGIEERPGNFIYAGLGWKNCENHGGIFVEHAADNKKVVISAINDTLISVGRYRCIEGDLKYKIIGKRCKDIPVCTLVAAVYKSEGWD